MLEDLEYSISQYLDGTLPPAELVELQKRLADDADARALLEQYQKLNETIKASASPMPAADWDALAGKISRAIVERDQPRDNYKIALWKGRARWMAIAASVLIAAGVAVHLIPNSPTIAVTPVAQIPNAEIHGPQIEPANGTALAEVKLTALAQFADALREYPNAEGVVVQQSHVTIASAVDHQQ